MRLLTGNANGKITIYFVQNATSNNKDMRMAFTACQEARLKAEIVSEEDVNDLPHGRTVVFVLEHFKGETFQFLSSKECLVVGPRCLCSCLSKKIPIPENESPVFTMAMAGIVVTASRMSRVEKQELANFIGYMGGSYTDQLTKAVTYLISDEGRSPKCEKAIELQIPIMCSSWVKAVWDASHIRDALATDAEFLKYRLAPFKGMHITCSNLPQSTKRKLQSLIESHGGVYMPTLEQNKTVVLIIGEAEGRKFQHAQLWGIPCLTPSWVYESVEKGAAVRSIDHIVVAKPKSSTPTSEPKSFMTNSDISIVPMAQDVSNMEIDETNMSVASSMLIQSLPKKAAKKQSQDNEYKQFMEEIDLVQATKAGPFLDGCKIYLSGFTPQETEKLKKVINRGGATIYTKITDRLSHIIVGAFDIQDAKLLVELKSKPHTVKLEWLLASIRQKSAASIEPYLCLHGSTAPPLSSPLSHKGVELLKSDINEPNQTVSRKLFTKDQVSISNEPPVQDGILKLRAQEEMDNLRKQNETQKEETNEPNDNGINEPAQNDANSTKNDSSVVVGPIFEGFSFVVIGFDDANTIEELIRNLHGKIYSNKFKGKVDYAVVPLISAIKVNAKHIVTSLWVEDCYEQEAILDVDYFHKPVIVTLGQKPLSGSVICISGIMGKERNFIAHLATALGAKVQDSFSRKNHPDKGIERATHLVCQTTSGSKYEAAIRWGIPTVKKEWLLSLLEDGATADLDTPSVNNEREIISTPVNPAMRRVIESTPSEIKATPSTSKRVCDVFACPEKPKKTISAESLEQNKESLKDASAKMNISLKSIDENFCTPDANKQFSFTSSGKSPFHMDTPDTPYGRVFLNDGDVLSPTAKKSWKKWIDNLPELYQKSPQIQTFRKRRPSTPLSVIMKQLWVKFGDAQIEGIDQETGDLLPDGPYREWAHENETIKVTPDNTQEFKENNKNNSSGGWLSKDQGKKPNNNLSNKETVEEIKKICTEGLHTTSAQSTKTVLRESHDQKSVSSDLNNGSKTKEESKCQPSTSWGSSKRTKTRCEMDEMPAWDFGKPNTLSFLTDNSEPELKKQKISVDTDCEKNEDMVIPETEELTEETEVPKTRRIFVLSNIPSSTREKFEGIIKSLGGEVSGLQCYDSDSTHLIIDKPVRSEKLLCSIASGKWVLHLSYLSQCYQSRTFLPEEDFEWGNERSKDRLPHLEPGTTEYDLAMAAHIWRVQRSHMSKPCAFRNIVAVICTSQNKYAQYKRLLEAGGATVLKKEGLDLERRKLEKRLRRIEDCIALSINRPRFNWLVCVISV
ncbi:DNA topoisomerase 2-binding protein 1-like isoform X2 [Cimex lectularius]|uniref:BRCT domain-containing protein n=1 Tax=Cimex lectularius TaxID=79782 RepID=A0A8I6SU20_CIMLE|nr:DNA topoisomerase 2-binding protein 1-like isoform X2 [Cimex lectularius]